MFNIAAAHAASVCFPISKFPPKFIEWGMTYGPPIPRPASGSSPCLLCYLPSVYRDEQTKQLFSLKVREYDFSDIVPTSLLTLLRNIRKCSHGTQTDSDFSVLSRSPTKNDDSKTPFDLSRREREEKMLALPSPSLFLSVSRSVWTKFRSEKLGRIRISCREKKRDAFNLKWSLTRATFAVLIFTHF